MDIPANRSNSLVIIGVHGPTPATGGRGALVFHLGLTILGIAGIGGGFVPRHRLSNGPLVHAMVKAIEENS